MREIPDLSDQGLGVHVLIFSKRLRCLGLSGLTVGEFCAVRRANSAPAGSSAGFCGTRSALEGSLEDGLFEPRRVGDFSIKHGQRIGAGGERIRDATEDFGSFFTRRKSD